MPRLNDFRVPARLAVLPPGQGDLARSGCIFPHELGALTPAVTMHG